MTIKDLVTASGLSQAAFAEAYRIPKRTVEDWCRGLRKPPEYVVWMISELQKRGEA